MKKLILLSLIISLCFSFNNSKENNIEIHTHKHSHIQGKSHVHEHSHMDNKLSFFYENQSSKSKEFTLHIEYTDVKNVYLNPINQNIFKPPII